VTVVRVQAAGNAVKRATEALVMEAQKVHSWSYSHEESSVTVDERMVGSMAQVWTPVVSPLVFTLTLS